MKDNIDRLLDALERPENYSDAEVEKILADPEARELYDMLHKTADASAPVTEIALVCTIAVVAATIGVTHYFNAQKEIAQTELAEPQEQTAIANSNVATADTIPSETTPLPETIVFKGESLEKILADIAGYYGATVAFNQDSAKSLKLYFEWNQALPLNEVVGQLNNFEQINITLTDKVLAVK